MTVEKRITNQITYPDTEFTKKDIIEIYCKFIANLGPLNVFHPKDISWMCKIEEKISGYAGYSINGIARALTGYIAVQLLDSMPNMDQCQMERTGLTGRRSIELENLPDHSVRMTYYNTLGRNKKLEDLARGLFQSRTELREQYKPLIDFLKGDLK